MRRWEPYFILLGLVFFMMPEETSTSAKSDSATLNNVEDSLESCEKAVMDLQLILQNFSYASITESITTSTETITLSTSPSTTPSSSSTTSTETITLSTNPSTTLSSSAIDESPTSSFTEETTESNSKDTSVSVIEESIYNMNAESNYSTKSKHEALPNPNTTRAPLSAIIYVGKKKISDWKKLRTLRSKRIPRSINRKAYSEKSSEKFILRDKFLQGHGLGVKYGIPSITQTAWVNEVDQTLDDINIILKNITENPLNDDNAGKLDRDTNNLNLLIDFANEFKISADEDQVNKLTKKTERTLKNIRDTEDVIQLEIEDTDHQRMVTVTLISIASVVFVAVIVVLVIIFIKLRPKHQLENVDKRSDTKPIKDKNEEEKMSPVDVGSINTGYMSFGERFGAGQQPSIPRISLERRNNGSSPLEGPSSMPCMENAPFERNVYPKHPRIGSYDSYR